MAKNKTVKQMIVDVVLQGRKAIWYGEETEIFACQNVEQIEAEFKEGCLTEMREYLESGERSEFVSWTDWKEWWKPCVFEIGTEPRKGKPVINSNGTINPYMEVLPIICGVNGDANKICQISTSYN